MEKYWLFYLLALVSEIIGTISGFGSSILFVPIASLFFDFKLVLGITAVFHVFSNLSKIFLFRKGFDKNIVLKLGLTAIISVVIGALLTSFIPQKEVELGMNIILIILAVYLVFSFKSPLQPTDKNLYIGGGISGFLAGLIGTGGAIRGIVLAAFNLEKNMFIATSAIIDLGVDFSRALVYIINGYFLKEFLLMIPFLIIISFLGSALGKYIINFTSQVTFRYIVILTIILSSIFQILKYLNLFDIKKVIE